MATSRWAVRVTWADGSDEYLRIGVGTSSDPVATFSKREVVEQKEFMLMGLDKDEIQGIAVVPAPEASDAHR